MKKIKLGHTPIEISQMGFGHCDFGTKVTKEKAFQIMDAYVEAGGNFIDTSNNYAVWNPGGKGGECETVIGEWMQSRGNRHEIVLATKVGANFADINTVTEPDGSLRPDWYLYGEGLSKAAIFRAIEGSLERLKTDYVDLYYAHVEDPKVDPSETLHAFDQLHRQGKIRAIGCSNHRTWRVEQARNISQAKGLIEYCCTQDLHTYLRADPDQRAHFTTEEKLDYLQWHPDMTLIAYTPTLWGKLAKTQHYEDPAFWGEFATPGTSARLKTLLQMAAKYETTPVQIIYAWMMQSSPSAIPLIATCSVEHLKENIASCEIILTPGDLWALNHAEAAESA